jgi:thymidylate synthase
MKNNVDKQYLELVENILNNGITKKDRTGTGTKSIFDYTMRFDMSDGFPILTSKKVFLKGIIVELLWFLGNHMKIEKYKKFGLTNIKYLVDNGVNIWIGDSYKKYEREWFLENPTFSKPLDKLLSKDEYTERIKKDDDFAMKWGDLGKIYGWQWTNCGGTDKLDGINQISILINDLKNNPDSRRLLVDAWGVNDLNDMVLPPCHLMFQCYTYEMDLDSRISEWCKSIDKDISYGYDFTHETLDSIGFPKRKLSLKWIQRSVDSALGLPYNISSYGILLHMLSKEVNMIPNELIFSGGDVHLYLNHISGIKEQVRRETFELPKLELSDKSMFDMDYTDIKLIEYKSSPSISFDLSN